jgi:hypothetical protein
LARRNAELERENRKLRRQLARAELISEIQKKAAGLMGIELMRGVGAHGEGSMATTNCVSSTEPS